MGNKVSVRISLGKTKNRNIGRLLDTAMVRAFSPHYHTYTEMVCWFKKWADEYPDLVDLYVVARKRSAVCCQRIS